MHHGFDAQQFSTEVEILATAALSSGDASSAVVAAHAVCDRAETECQQHVGIDNAIDCRAGCAHCCIVNVAVLEPEALSIVDHLVNGQTDSELWKTYHQLTELDRETRWLDDEERVMVRKRCVFLTMTGSCDIYPVRPLLCRAVTSTDSVTCKEALAMVALGENIPVIANLTQREIFETAFGGFGKALENNKLDSQSYRLTGSVQSFLHKHLH